MTWSEHQKASEHAAHGTKAANILLALAGHGNNISRRYWVGQEREGRFTGHHRKVCLRTPLRRRSLMGRVSWPEKTGRATLRALLLMLRRHIAYA